MAISVLYPNHNRNYCIFNEEHVVKNVKKGEDYLPKLKYSLNNPTTEEQTLEDLYTLNLMIDNGLKREYVEDLYPILSKYNDTTSPNIQTFLAGIYRKTKIPDAFGPLIKMLIQDSINPPTNCYFDPTEEIGGAILDYLA